MLGVFASPTPSRKMQFMRGVYHGRQGLTQAFHTVELLRSKLNWSYYSIIKYPRNCRPVKEALSSAISSHLIIYSNRHTIT
jgi:hypothetical protein